MSATGDIVLWRRPGLAVLVLICGTLVYYHCTARNRHVVALASDLLLVVSWSLALLGYIYRSLNLSILPVDPLEWELSEGSANCIAEMVANSVGAAEGVLRIAATGSDRKLFLKVILALYLLSAIGRSASGATIVYMALWIVFIVPFCTLKLAPEAKTPPFLQRLQYGNAFVGGS